MWIKNIEDGLSNDYETKSKWIAALFILVGLTIAFYSLFSPQTPSAILGVALTVSGLLSAYLTAKLNLKIPVSWLKSLLIFFTGMFFLFIGLDTLATIGLVVGLFFLFGTFNNLYLTYLTRKNSTAIAWFLHAMVSATFAIEILLNINTLTGTEISLYVAINLIADALVVLYSGRTIFIRP